MPAFKRSLEKGKEQFFHEVEISAITRRDGNRNVNGRESFVPFSLARLACLSINVGRNKLDIASIIPFSPLSLFVIHSFPSFHRNTSSRLVPAEKVARAISVLFLRTTSIEVSVSSLRRARTGITIAK